MAAGAWTFPDGTRTDIADGVLRIATDTYKCALFLSTSNIGAASTTYAALTNEHANSNCYLTGGISVDLTLSGTTSVKFDIATDPVWTAAGGSILFRPVPRCATISDFWKPAARELRPASNPNRRYPQRAARPFPISELKGPARCAVHPMKRFLHRSWTP